MILLSNSLRKLNTVNLTNVNSIYEIHFSEKSWNLNFMDQM
ncbi:hypothetical protein LEP1GSC021_4147 [Leptospira noguchii str. 1993005606]|uniref:Uncharacterized protein n=1 Tax=Leptospira noguchii serovar Autumnalis str. ZUN142 TaxID=1085540 RepID=M6U9B8_9LEPT|nr:hypothetical protein LEP1GSC041_3441 [Leptospira noguchii str. 2006001870]EMO41095.1 hypothetical protein LEP1GSC186_4683 [Leptospira noguchii serovar Autumnalis str. ZUN142]EMS82860.1 hypothetical protein LEP1GSC074_3449 [Leptospira noguchii str. Hook]EPE81982.1 hypothetical protein LEP1GSC021_4147 [Leptospira noguchii str. 1993005606]